MTARWESLLEQLVRERYTRLVGHAMLVCGSRHDAQDLVQEALIATFSGRARFTTVPQAEQYVRRAIVTRSIDESRRRTRERAAAARLGGLATTPVEIQPRGPRRRRAACAPGASPAGARVRRAPPGRGPVHPRDGRRARPERGRSEEVHSRRDRAARRRARDDDDRQGDRTGAAPRRHRRCGMNELGELLGEAAEELSPTETLDDLGFARMVRSVRRRRVQRHTVESVVGVAAAGVVGTAAWAGLKYTAPAPADTPAPSVSATPTESPAVLPVPPTFGQVTAAPATAATIADARAGWVLASSSRPTSSPGPRTTPSVRSGCSWSRPPRTATWCSTCRPVRRTR